MDGIENVCDSNPCYINVGIGSAIKELTDTDCDDMADNDDPPASYRTISFYCHLTIRPSSHLLQKEMVKPTLGHEAFAEDAPFSYYSYKNYTVKNNKST